MKYYTASLDILSKAVTTFIFILFLGLSAHQVYILQTDKSGTSTWITVSMVGLLAAILLVSYLFKADGYRLTSDALIIERPVGGKIILLTDIIEVEVPTKKSMYWTIRTFGNGGLFGYWGKFANTNYGNMTWYATRRSNYILLTIKDKGLIVITPDDLSLANALRNKLN
jgi:hypothetical protein